MQRHTASHVKATAFALQLQALKRRTMRAGQASSLRVRLSCRLRSATQSRIMSRGIQQVQAMCASAAPAAGCLPPRSGSACRVPLGY